ncbi:MAG: SCP2 sterol-binding domain-containing protein [Amphritea sp.]
MTFETINATLLTLAESVINLLLCCNPAIQQRLLKLDGKVIAVRLDTPGLSLSIQPNPNGLQLDLIERSDADVTLTGSASDFFQLLTAQEKSDALFGKSIAIEGDSGLATVFSQILIDAALDWEGILAEIIGDLPAHQLARYLRWKAAFYLNTGSSLMQNTEEYLHEEIRLLPTRAEIDHFLQQVDTLKEDTERAEARLQKLQQTLTN